MLRVVIACAILALALGNEIYLKAGEYHVFKNEGPKLTKVLKFRSAPNENLKVYCDDFRLPTRGDDEDGCNLSKVTFDDGVKPVKKCKTDFELLVTSARDTLTINVELDYGGFFECVVKTTEETNPITVHLSPGDDGFLFTVDKENPVPYLDRTWKFTAAENSRLSYQCSISYMERNPCLQEVLIVNDGKSIKEYCTGSTAGFSDAQSLSIRVRLNKFGDATTRCIIQSVTGLSHNQVQNLVSVEEDSTEYGVKAGKVGTTCKCGWVNKGKPAKRIFHGKETTEGEYPWMVAIIEKGERQKCGGSVITPFHVLTAAHCVSNSAVRDMSKIVPHAVIVGSYNHEEESSHGETQTIDVSKFFIPNDWLTFKRSYDISVLLLAKEIRYSQYVGPICMPQPNNPYKLTYKRVKITGWGYTHEGHYPNTLKTTRLWVLSNQVCPSPLGIICTYSKSSSICYGDSGGPYVYLDPDTNRYTQISVNSYTNHESCVASSGSANVSYHMDFILDSIKRSKPQSLCTKV